MIYETSFAPDFDASATRSLVTARIEDALDEALATQVRVLGRTSGE